MIRYGVIVIYLFLIATFHSYTVVRSGAPAATSMLSDYFPDIKSQVISGPDPAPTVIPPPVST